MDPIWTIKYCTGGSKKRNAYTNGIGMIRNEGREQKESGISIHNRTTIFTTVTTAIHEELKRGESRNKDKQVAILTDSRNTLNTIALRLRQTRKRTRKKEENIWIDKIVEQLIETEKEKINRPRKGQTRKKNRQI